jgi:hypothetical protein
MLANAYLESEDYDSCDQTCNYMSKTFPNENSVQMVSFISMLSLLIMTKICVSR